MADFPAITHVALTVSDLNRSRGWYEQLIGAKPVLELNMKHALVKAIGSAHKNQHAEDVNDLSSLLLEQAQILDGEVPDDPGEAFAGWRKALRLPNVRGLLAGRSLLYPADGDVATAVDTAVGLL